MYFDATEECKLRNGINPPEEMNGDESLLRGEITQLLRASKFILCRGPKNCAEEIKNSHAWATEIGTPDKCALVAFPVISRKRCHLLQIIVKGNPHPRTAAAREKQRKLIEDIVAAFPAQLRPVVFVNFTKKGYQTGESFKDACRALLIALSREEDPVANAWMNFYTTSVDDIPRLRVRRMFKFDGSSTHCLDDIQHILEMRTRNVIMWPYPPNATAFIQELDQLCLWIYKNHAKRILKLELEFESEGADVTSDPTVHFVWLEDVARAYDADLEQFQPVSASEPSGLKKNARRYECRPDAMKIMDEMLERRGTPWGPVRLAKMLGWALGQALLTPFVLEASFNACTRDFVFSRPLVKRELDFKMRQDQIRAAKLVELASVGNALRGTLDFSMTLQIPSSIGGSAMQPIHDDKWKFFRTKVLQVPPSEQLPGEAKMRDLCALFSSFSVDYDPVARNSARVSELAERYQDNETVLAAQVVAASAQARSKLEADFAEWVGKLVTKIEAHLGKLENVHAVSIPAVAQQLSQTRVLAGSKPSDSAPAKQIKVFQAAFQKQSNSFHKAKGDVSLALQDASVKLVQFNSDMSAHTAKMFPNSAAPAPAASRVGFNDVVTRLDEKIKVMQAAMLAITTSDDVSVPAPAPRVRKARAAPVVAVVAAGAAAPGVNPAAAPEREAFMAQLIRESGPPVVAADAAAASASSSDDEEVTRRHAEEQRAREERAAAERADIQRRHAEAMQSLDEQ